MLITTLGANRDGYWTANDLIKQLEEQAIPIFKKLHGSRMGVFVFHQSSNHTAYAPDALVPSRMTLGPKVHDPKTDKYNFKDTKYQGSKLGRSVPQKFYDTHYVYKKKGRVLVKEFKGIKRILQERGLWYDKDPTPERQGKKWRLDCGSDIPTLQCCARHCLASQPDFHFQR